MKQVIIVIDTRDYVVDVYGPFETRTEAYKYTDYISEVYGIAEGDRVDPRYQMSINSVKPLTRRRR